MTMKKKTILILGLAALTATTTMTIQTTSAEAGRGFRIGVGIGLGVGLAMRHRHHHRHVYRTPVRTETYRAARAQPSPVSKVVFADGKGREYDPASKVWFDGKDACWTGKQKWAFKNGAWAYGSKRWYEAGGTWQTDTDGEPVPVDCKASPLFAAKIKTGTGQKAVAQNGTQNSEGRGNASEGGESPVRAAVKPPSEEPAKITSQTRECKKYFPAVGEMLPVPCT